LNYAPKKTRRPQRDRDAKGVAKEAATPQEADAADTTGKMDTAEALTKALTKMIHAPPGKVNAVHISRKVEAADPPPKVCTVTQRSGAPEPPEPPWKRTKQREVFVGDVAIAELRTRLALAPDRLPAPPSPPATAPEFGTAAWLAGAVVVAAAGFVGYQWGAAPKAAPRQQVMPSAKQADLLPERPASAAYVKTSSLDARPWAVRPAADDLAPGPAIGSTRSMTNGARSANTTPTAFLSPTAVQPAYASSATSKPMVPSSGDKELQPQWSGKSAPAPAKSPSRQLGAAEIALMVKNGAELMANGYIGAARMMFQPAAEAGDPVAAFALGETYDPLVLRKLRTRGGITPDVALAHNWYKKAMEWGSAVAPARLERLARLPE
jgi:hypothetical protein